MRKIVVLSCVGIAFGVQALAQKNYVHTVGSATYQDLAVRTILNSPDTIEEAYYVNSDFLFPAFGAFANFKSNTSVPSLGAYVTRAGYLAVYESPGYNFTDVFHGYYNTDLIKVNSSSFMAVQLTGNAGNKLLKFEWKNMGLKGHTSAEYLSFQIWFSESDKTISYHYGPSTMVFDTTDIGTISVLRAPNNFANLTHCTNLGGDAIVPDSFVVANPKSFSQMYGIYNFPPNGTVITFKPDLTGGLGQMGMDKISVYPNPTKGFFNIDGMGLTDNSTIEIYNSLGTMIYSGTNLKGLNSIDLSDQANGLYVVKVRAESGSIATQKVVKE